MQIDTGNTAWVLASSALVLLMTPGLAFFYGGMVRMKNVLAMLMQNYLTMAIVRLLWIVVMYRLTFGAGSGSVGNLHFLGFAYMVKESVQGYIGAVAAAVTPTVFAAF